ncbi:MAG: polysaccharide deacetylase family protein [Patescibacteria group bacterium]|nr:polysaccharide deacetylase family protein [Patescibacteria group bacterium]MDD5715972.1 polysaccharide deacetylase family protein [Patescibacteria group bacterium]
MILKLSGSVRTPISENTSTSNHSTTNALDNSLPPMNSTNGQGADQEVPATEPEVTVVNTEPVVAPATQTSTGPEIVRGDDTKQQVIFTFDAGSGNQSIGAILETLGEHGITASFFLTGKWAEKNEDSVRAIAEAGHEMFNHTYSHPHLPTLNDEDIRAELSETEAIIERITGTSTKPYFRPPYGDRTSHVLEVASAAGYRSVFWTVDALDWQESEGMTAAQVQDRILSKLAPGNIYLMHVGDTLTGAVLDRVLAQIEQAGYSIVPLSEGVK